MTKKFNKNSANNLTSKLFILFAFLLVTLLFGFVVGGSTAYAKDPPPLADTYVFDGITYYNVNSSHINSPQLFYGDLFNANHSSLGGFSLAKLWLMLGAGLIDTSGSKAFLDKEALVDCLQSALLSGEIPEEYKYTTFNFYGFSYSAPTWNGSYLETSCSVNNYYLNSNFKITARFSDFSIIALMPGDTDHYISTIENKPKTFTTVDPMDLDLRNDTATTANLNASVTNSYTQGFQTSFNHSANYTFCELIYFT